MCFQVWEIFPTVPVALPACFPPADELFPVPPFPPPFGAEAVAAAAFFAVLSVFAVFAVLLCLSELPVFFVLLSLEAGFSWTVSFFLPFCSVSSPSFCVLDPEDFSFAWTVLSLSSDPSPLFCPPGRTASDLLPPYPGLCATFVPLPLFYWVCPFFLISGIQITRRSLTFPAVSLTTITRSF